MLTHVATEEFCGLWLDTTLSVAILKRLWKSEVEHRYCPRASEGVRRANAFGSASTATGGEYALTVPEVVQRFPGALKSKLVCPPVSATPRAFRSRSHDEGSDGEPCYREGHDFGNGR